jgi:hypothetical protein
LASFPDGEHFAGDIAAHNVRHAELQNGNFGAYKKIRAIERASACAQDFVGINLGAAAESVQPRHRSLCFR